MTWWQTVSAIGAVMLPVVGGLFAYSLWFVRSTARAENARSNADQQAQNAATYTRSASSNLTGAEIENRLDESKEILARLRSDLSELHLYAHVKVHDSVGDLAALRVGVELLKSQMERAETAITKLRAEVERTRAEGERPK